MCITSSVLIRNEEDACGATDTMFGSLAEEFGSRSIGILLGEREPYEEFAGLDAVLNAGM